MKRVLKRLFLSVIAMGLLAIISGGAWLRWRTLACLPILDGALQVPGPSARVEVLRDARGVPHIRAQSLPDVLFAQGYVTAQDRLWQMDLSRRMAEGELSEIFGNRTLRLDIESRTLGLYRVAEQALADLPPDERRLLDAYVQGINAFMEGHRTRLPIEFLLLRYRPKPWRALDSVAAALNLSTSLNRTWESDLMREHIAARLNKELFSDLFPDHSPLDEPVAVVLPGVHGNVTTAGTKVGGGPFQDHLFTDVFAPTQIESEGGMGSNNWVVSGAHTQSGKPLLANDPHLGHSIPSVWYMIHLKAPELDVTGVSLPGVPFVILGHNEHIAWGMTNTGPDVQDLYIESFNPGDPGKYLHNGQWVDAEIRGETIRVRKQRDYHFTVKVTRHGPVIYHDGGRDLALQWTLLSPHATRIPFLQINQAGNWQEFTAALRDFKVPMQNCVYADAEGNIGFYAAGLVPIRKQGNGSVPVDGSNDDHDWTGFIPFEDLPHAYNPTGGVLATANGRIVPDSYPYFITARWESPFRTARIFQLLHEKGSFTVADMLRIQTDILTLEDQWLARQLLTAAVKEPPSGAEAQLAIHTLENWDAEASADSAATLILELTRRALLARILKPKLGDDLSGYLWPMSTVFLQNVLEQNLTRWLPPGDADFTMSLMKSLDTAIKDIPAKVHSHSHEAWRWGDTIPLVFHHPLGGGSPFLGRILDVGPFPQAGTGSTVKQTSPRIGPSMRMVVDFSDLDQSLQNITLGESGQPFSTYYSDQLPSWYSGHSFPMLFSDHAVEKGTVHKLVLEPGP